MKIAYIWIVAILIFGVSFVFIGAVEALWLAELYLGFVFLIVGVLMMSNAQFRDKYYRINDMNSSEWERAHSEEEKNKFDKYYFPGRGIAGGIGMIFLFWLTHHQMFAAIGSWLAKLF
jgi:hypothetical protein